MTGHFRQNSVLMRLYERLRKRNYRDCRSAEYRAAYLHGVRDALDAVDTDY